MKFTERLRHALSLPEHKYVTTLAFSDVSIRIISASRMRGKTRVHHLGAYPLADGIIMGNQVFDPGRLTESLRFIKKEYKLAKIRLVIPGASLFSGVLTLQFQESSNRTDALVYAIEKFVQDETGYNTARVRISHEVLNETRDSAEIYVSVILRREADPYLRACKEVGLVVTSLQTQHDALAKYHTRDKDHALLMLDVGTHETKASVYSGGRVYNQKLFDVGVAHMYEYLERHLSGDSERAAEILWKYGLLPSHKDERVRNVLYSMVHPIQHWVNQQYIDWHSNPYKDTQRRRPITSVVVMGDGVALPGFIGYLRKYTRLPVSNVDVWKGELTLDHEVPKVHAGHSVYLSLIHI